MFFQNILALWDKTISNLLRLQSWGGGDQKGRNQWIFLVDIGHTIGVIGVDGKIHTIMGYWSVRHHYDGKKLLKRIPVRKNLKEGERLATKEEMVRHRKSYERSSQEFLVG